MVSSIQNLVCENFHQPQCNAQNGSLNLICTVWNDWVEIVILWVYYTIHSGFVFSLAFFGITFLLFLSFFVWLRITNKGSIPEMHTRIWSILLMKSNWKWCIHLSRSLFYMSATWWVPMLFDQRVPEEHVAKFYGWLRLIPVILRA